MGVAYEVSSMHRTGEGGGEPHPCPRRTKLLQRIHLEGLLEGKGVSSWPEIDARSRKKDWAV